LTPERNANGLEHLVRLLDGERSRQRRLFCPQSPNPFTSRVALSLTASQPEAVSITVYDIRGREVSSMSRFLTPGAQTIELDGSTWGAGVYMVAVSSRDGSETRSIVKAR